MTEFLQENSSFRDPSGVLFYYNEELYRQINTIYKDEYDLLLNSGLYEELTKKEFLIPHEEVEIQPFEPEKYYKIIKPKKIPFISYSFEWSFSQFKDAALLVLEIQKIAMNYGMKLKDATSYNIQFFNGKPILIDSLSFEKYKEGDFWEAYRQFCQHFFAPLVLMSHKDIRLNQLLRIFIDGIPLDLASKLLPTKTKMVFSILTHIHAHSKSQKHYEDKTPDLKEKKLSKNSYLGIIESLHSGIKKLSWKSKDTEWGDYYSDTNYSDVAFSEKKAILNDLIEKIKPDRVIDLGANTGIFSRIASNKGIETISYDIDPIAVEKNYLQVKKDNETKLLPLQIDLTNPSPNLGWRNNERMSFMDRGITDTVIALALIHHLAISNNLPFEQITQFFSQICKNLIIEFVPKSDSQVQRLLSTRKDIFDQYTQENFEKTFGNYFKIIESIKVKDSERVIYRMTKI